MTSPFTCIRTTSVLLSSFDGTYGFTTTHLFVCIVVARVLVYVYPHTSLISFDPLPSRATLAPSYLLLRSARNHAGFRTQTIALIGQENGVKTNTFAFAFKMMLKTKPMQCLLPGMFIIVILTSILIWFTEKFAPGTSSCRHVLFSCVHFLMVSLELFLEVLSHSHSLTQSYLFSMPPPLSLSLLPTSISLRRRYRHLRRSNLANRCHDLNRWLR